MRGARVRWGSILAGMLLAVVLVASANAARPPLEDVLKGGERLRDPQATSLLQTTINSGPGTLQSIATQLSRPGELFYTNVCASDGLSCRGDDRLRDWESAGRGIVAPVRFTARSGAALSGRVWATRSGPKRRPLVVIVNGSVQAPEQLYWWAAQLLAKDGYVVLTYDPQTQGQSTTAGTGADTLPGALSQGTGEAFYDGPRDALDFALSTPGKPYCPQPGRSGTSHCDEQRTVAGRTAFNPLHDMIDPSRVGLAGHSYGAMGVSAIGQLDPRVDAIVAWDNLCDPTTAPEGGGLPDPAGGIGGASCSGSAKPRVDVLRVPALGLTADSFFVPDPLSDRDPDGKNAGSKALSAKGIDTGSIVIRGGTHFEFSYLPTPPFFATLRGIDLASWYTAAWFDRYVKGDRSALTRLWSDRWRHDPGDAAVDPAGGGNLLSRVLRSRLDVTLADGTRATCEDLREGCPAMLPSSQDVQPADWGYVGVDTQPEPAPAFTPIRSVRQVRVGKPRRLGNRRVRVRVAPVAGATPLDVRVRLRRGGKVIATKRLTRLDAPRRLTFRVRRAPARVVVRSVDRYGRPAVTRR